MRKKHSFFHVPQWAGNFWEKEALATFGSQGLTAKMLKHHLTGGHEFNEHHQFALRDLVQRRKFTVNQADEIEGLNSSQLFDIAEKRLTRADVIHSNIPRLY